MTLLADVEAAVRLGLVDVRDFSTPPGLLLADRQGRVHADPACVRLPRWSRVRPESRSLLMVPRSQRCRCVVYPQEALTPYRRARLAAVLPLVRLDRACAGVEDVLFLSLDVSRLPSALSELALAQEGLVSLEVPSSLRPGLEDRARRLSAQLSAFVRTKAGRHALLAALRSRHWARDSLSWDASLSVVDLTREVVSAAQGDALALLLAFGLPLPSRRLLLVPSGAVPLVRTAFGVEASRFLVGEVGPEPSDELLELFLGLWDPALEGPLSDPARALEAARALLSS